MRGSSRTRPARSSATGSPCARVPAWSSPGAPCGRTARASGIGAALLERIERRAAEHLAGTPDGTFRHGIDAADVGAEALVRARGLQPVRRFCHMQRNLDGRVDPGPAPAGLRIVAVDADRDLPAVHDVLQRAFAEHWGHFEEPFERWAADVAAGPGYDPGLWLLARDGDEPAGILVAEVLDGRGWIADLGVLTPWRGRGLGAALLRRAFQTFRARGLREVMLTWTARTPPARPCSTSASGCGSSGAGTSGSAWATRGRPRQPRLRAPDRRPHDVPPPDRPGA